MGRGLARIYGKWEEATSLVGKTGRGLAPADRRGVARARLGRGLALLGREGRGPVRRAVALSLRAPESGVTAA